MTMTATTKAPRSHATSMGVCLTTAIVTPSSSSLSTYICLHPGNHSKRNQNTETPCRGSWGGVGKHSEEEYPQGEIASP